MPVILSELDRLRIKSASDDLRIASREVADAQERAQAASAALVEAFKMAGLDPDKHDAAVYPNPSHALGTVLEKATGKPCLDLST